MNQCFDLDLEVVDSLPSCSLHCPDEGQVELRQCWIEVGMV